jgi:hypothetical protein
MRCFWLQIQLNSKTLDVHKNNSQTNRIFRKKSKMKNEGDLQKLLRVSFPPQLQTLNGKDTCCVVGTQMLAYYW